MMSEEDIIIFSGNKLLAQFDKEKRHMEYIDALLDENQRVNLVSRETGTVGMVSLYKESLVPMELVTGSHFDSYLDLGSGGGIPAIPLLLSGAIKNGTLIERIEKKAAALQRICLALKIKPKILSINLEEKPPSGKYDLISVRLVRLDQKLLKTLSSLLGPGGQLVYFSDYDSSYLPEGLSKQLYRYRIDEQTVAKSLTIFQKSP